VHLNNTPGIKTIMRLQAVFLLFLMCGLGACSSSNTFNPPAEIALKNAIGTMYSLAGLGQEIQKATVLGKHYSPSSDHWQVFACVEFGQPDSLQTDCNDSFTLLKLDSGKWIIRGRVNAVYRWLEVAST